MAKTCIFCQRELSMLGGKTLYCCNTRQPICGPCLSQMVDLPAEERGRRALATGRAETPDVIQAFLEAKAAREEEQRRASLSDKLCLRCGIPMLKMGRQQFQLGEHSFFLGDLSHLMSGSLTVDMLRCEGCRKVEFFLPEDGEEDK